MLDRYFLGIRG